MICCEWLSAILFHPEEHVVAEVMEPTHLVATIILNGLYATIRLFNSFRAVVISIGMVDRFDATLKAASQLLRPRPWIAEDPDHHVACSTSH